MFGLTLSKKDWVLGKGCVGQGGCSKKGSGSPGPTWNSIAVGWVPEEGSWDSQAELGASGPAEFRVCPKAIGKMRIHSGF